MWSPWPLPETPATVQGTHLGTSWLSGRQCPECQRDPFLLLEKLSLPLCGLILTKQPATGSMDLPGQLRSGRHQIMLGGFSKVPSEGVRNRTALHGVCFISALFGVLPQSRGSELLLEAARGSVGVIGLPRLHGSSIALAQRMQHGPGLAERGSDTHVFRVSPIFMAPLSLQLSSSSRPDRDAESSAGGLQAVQICSAPLPACHAPPHCAQSTQSVEKPSPSDRW